MRTKFDIKKVNTLYTGGNIYVFLGALNDGTFFMAESSCFDVRIFNEDPSAVEDDEDGDNAIWYPEWQIDHLVKDLSESECLDLFVAMLRWIQRNDSDNYCSDFRHLMKEVKELQRTTGWR